MRRQPTPSAWGTADGAGRARARLRFLLFLLLGLTERAQQVLRPLFERELGPAAGTFEVRRRIEIFWGQEPGLARGAYHRRQSRCAGVAGSRSSSRREVDGH